MARPGCNIPVPVDLLVQPDLSALTTESALTTKSALIVESALTTESALTAESALTTKSALKCTQVPIRQGLLFSSLQLLVCPSIVCQLAQKRMRNG